MFLSNCHFYFYFYFFLLRCQQIEYGSQVLVEDYDVTVFGDTFHMYQTRRSQANLPRTGTNNIIFTVEFDAEPFKMVTQVNIDDGWFFLCLLGGVSFLGYWLFK